ncbi:MAG TPA: LysA protein [Mycobacterium sp.]|nr:LysA protein [Mycobacterium sp.]
MTLSTSFRSIVRGRQDSARRHDERELVEHAVMRQLKACRKSLSPAEVSLPAAILAGEGIAPWVREHRLAVDVRSMAELYGAISSGIHPRLITAHTHTLTVTEVQRVASFGVGRVVLSSPSHIDLLGAADDEREQNVLLRMRPRDAAPGRPGFVFDSHQADFAVAQVLNQPRLNLVGLHCDVGSAEDDFVSYPAAVGDMIAQMEHIRRQHGLLLTCLGIGGGTFFATDDEHPLCELIARVDESVDDACATLRFPRPVVVIAAGTEVIGQVAA